MISTAGRTHFLDFGSFRLDLSNRLLLRNGEHVALTQKSFEMLLYLVRNRNRMLRKQEILDEVWKGSYVEEANLAQHIYMVRKALKVNGANGDYIETIPKYGYRFNGEVSEGVEDVQDDSAANGGPMVRLASAQAAVRAVANGHAYRAPLKNQPTGTRPYRLPVLVISAVAVALFASVLAAAGLIYFSQPADPHDVSRIRSISVLPFDQIGGEKDDKLSLGLADTLISRLGVQNSVTILPTSSIAKFNGDTRPPLEVGRELGVDAILTGTIQIEGERVRINVQLISVEARAPVWTQRIDTEFSDVFRLQDEISGEVAAKLASSLRGLPDRGGPSSEPRNPAAVQAFEKGIYFWNKRSSDSLSKAIGHFTEAIKADPSFAQAHAMLADSYALAAVYEVSSGSADKVIEDAKKSASRAIAIDPKVSEAYSAKAVIAQYEKDAASALGYLKKAIALKPGNAIARLRLAWMYAVDEDLGEAIREMKRAQEADPDSQVINLNLARLLRLNRQTDEALEFGKRAVELDPSMTWTRLILAEIYEQKGMLDESIKELRSVPGSAPEQKTAKLLLSRVLAKKGNKGEARKILESVTQGKPVEAPSYEIATVYALLGEKQEAFEELRKSDEDSLIHYLHVKYDYNLDTLRDNPKYPGILTQSKRNFIEAYDKNS